MGAGWGGAALMGGRMAALDSVELGHGTQLELGYGTRLFLISQYCEGRFAARSGEFGRGG